MTNQKYLIGLDCGASFTKVSVWQGDQNVFSKSDWPGINMDLIDNKETFNFLSELKKYPNAKWVIALAGVDNNQEKLEAKLWWTKLLNNYFLVFTEIQIISDIELVLWAGGKEGTGIALIAGTGSNCFGIDYLGNTYKVGGMSHLLSDEGSGYSLGSECLHLVTKMSDGRLQTTSLLDKTFELYEQKNIVDLKNYLLNHPHQKAEVARCATLVLESTDPHCEKIISNATDELKLMVITLKNKMYPNANNNLFLAGSLFKNHRFLGLLTEKIHRTSPEMEIAVVNPQDGFLNLQLAQ